MCTHHKSLMLACALALTPCSSKAADPVTVHAAGYSYGPFVTTSATGVEDIDLDSDGNVYACASGDIRRITPAGAVAPWSSAVAFDIVFTSGGQAYGAGRALCHCIQSISPDGSFAALHSDSLEWSYVAIGSGGALYGNIPAGLGQGLYTINLATGVPSQLVNGGPGTGGLGSYSAMVGGQDGKLYLTGYDGGVSTNIYRLDGNQLTSIGNWPHGGLGLAQDNQGIFYTSVTIVPQFGPLSHEVWMFDPKSGLATLLAEGGGGSNSIAYDRARNFLYVQNGSSIYILAKSATPTRRDSWTHVKNMYH